MSKLRYRLTDQIHFIAADPDLHRDVVVTLQRWQSKTSATQIYVRLHDGTEQIRGLANTDELRARIDESFASAYRDFGQVLLSDDAAADQVRRNGGPQIKWCNAGECGAQIPYGSAQCADGHAATHINPGTYSHGTSRRPPITVITGGKR